MGTFTKIAVKFSVFKNFSPIFFTKSEWNIDIKNVQKHDFWSNIVQIMKMSNMLK
jgi:hypothetical protein